MMRSLQQCKMESTARQQKYSLSRLSHYQQDTALQ